MFRSISELISMPRIFNNKSGHGQDTNYLHIYKIFSIEIKQFLCVHN